MEDVLHGHQDEAEDGDGNENLDESEGECGFTIYEGRGMDGCRRSDRVEGRGSGRGWRGELRESCCSEPWTYEERVTKYEPPARPSASTLEPST